jgi:hypothetical protein
VVKRGIVNSLSVISRISNGNKLRPARPVDALGRVIQDEEKK